RRDGRAVRDARPRARSRKPADPRPRDGARQARARFRAGGGLTMLPYALREALNSFRRAPLLLGLSAGMIALSLFVVGLFGIAAYNVNRGLQRVEERVEIVAYLRDGARLNAIELARNEIAMYPEVLDVIYVSREQALEIARQELGQLHSMVVELDVNPLP